ILKEIRARRYPEAKRLLDEFSEKLDNLQKFFDEVKKLCRDSGKTSVVSIQALENLIVKYGEKK
ncbi:unnamed protein product, partial [marine sediment metagenome]